MKIWIKYLAIVATATVLAACGQKGSEFVGKWQSKDFAGRQAVIEKNGDNFLLKNIQPSAFTRGQVETTTIPATYKDGVLEAAGGFGTAKIGYVKATDTLLMPTMGGSIEYRRVK
jgi:hypothetical protein